MTTNRFATWSRGTPEERAYVQGPLDQLETPEEVTTALLEIENFRNVLDPCAGSGKIVGACLAAHVEATGSDLVSTAMGRRHGIRKEDFLKMEPRSWHGDLITNPPYSQGRAEAFTRKALDVATGRVAMLLPAGFAWGSKRAAGIWREIVPEAVVIIPWRIIFTLPDGSPISGQFNDHAWFVFPPVGKRNAPTPMFPTMFTAVIAREPEVVA